MFHDSGETVENAKINSKRQKTKLGQSLGIDSSRSLRESVCKLKVNGRNKMAETSDDSLMKSVERQ